MTEDLNPKIRFNGEWIPAHKAWASFATAMSIAENIERFNQRWPNLATDATRTIVPKVREQLKLIELYMPERKEASTDLGKTAAKLLVDLGPEETIERIRDEFGQELDLQALVNIAGFPIYLKALSNEVRTLRRNQVSSEQTAKLWNELGRPAPGDGTWTEEKVDRLLA